ncbi:MAG: acyltransferase family protein, partial [Kiritimatiellia bacterium]
MNEHSASFASKPRFEVLDGLRGIAALLVVAFHLLESYSGGDHTRQILNHGYLAVDFFFVLSGFVIGYAYDDRWGQGLTLREFFKRRLVRLHPMVVFGTLLGAALFYFGA